MDPSALPARAADLVDAARDAPTMPPEVLARIYAQIGATGQARGVRAWPHAPGRARRLPLGLRMATLMALLLVSVATAKGALVLWRRYVVPTEPTEPSENRRATARSRIASTRDAKPQIETPPVVNVNMEAPAPSAEIEVTPVRAAAPDGATGSMPSRHRHAVSAERHPPAARASRAASPEMAVPADAANEAQLLADALARLRQAHDPRGALALLDRYAATYPHGVLVSESRSARLEAMLKLDDRRGALALLDERTTFAGRLGAEQLLTRAELRASAGRYAEALDDFDRSLPSPAILTSPASASLERALYGRAVTLGHLGRDARARADLEAYLHRFPAGKHSAEVSRLLGRAP